MDRAKDLLARMNATQSAGGRYMWYMVVADAVLTMMARQETVSRDELIALMEERSKNCDRLLADGYEAAIAILRDPSSYPPETS